MGSNAPELVVLAYVAFQPAQVLVTQVWRSVKGIILGGLRARTQDGHSGREPAPDDGADTTARTRR
jgi:hypothetical protein